MVFGLFKKNNKESKETSRYFKLRLRDVVPVAKDAVNLVFEKPDFSFVYQSGQFITIIDNVKGEKVRRAYSLCTSPSLDEFPAVTVKRVPDGRLSNHINDNYKAGQEVEVMEPMGKFVTEINPSGRKAVFIGGGSGITPLISLIRTILSQETASELLLLYGNRSVEYIIFKDLIEELQVEHSGRFKVIHILEEDEQNFAQLKGRVSQGMIADVLKEYSQSEFYLCGPKPMMDIAVDGLKALGVNDQQIRMESFESNKIDAANPLMDASESAEVRIHLDGEDFQISVPKNKTILEVALDEGLDMPYSCQSGLCTACRGKCLEGDVSTDEAEGLTQDELNEGYRLLCIGKPVTDSISIEIG